MTARALRTPAIILTLCLGLWFASQEWGVIALAFWSGTAALIASDKSSQASEDIGTVIFVIILLGLAYTFGAWVFGLFV